MKDIVLYFFWLFVTYAVWPLSLVLFYFAFVDELILFHFVEGFFCAIGGCLCWAIGFFLHDQWNN